MTSDHTPDEEATCASCPDAARADGVWRVLVADPDEETLALHKLCLSLTSFEGRRVEVLTARTVGGALFHARRSLAIAVMIVSFDLEKPGDGPRLIAATRSLAATRLTRVALRGGASAEGDAAAVRAVEALGVFDWRDDGDTSLSRLQMVVLGALAAYRDRVTLEAARRSKAVVREALARAAADDLGSFVHDGLIELTHRLAHAGRETEVCGRACGLVVAIGEGEGAVISGRGTFATWAGTSIHDLPDSGVVGLIKRAARSGAAASGEGGVALPFRRGALPDLVVFLALPTASGAAMMAEDDWRVFIDGVGAVLAARNLSRELDRERRHRDRAERRQRSMELASEHAPFPVMRLSASGDVVHANPLAAMIAGGWERGPDGTRRCPWSLPGARRLAGNGQPDGGPVDAGRFELTTAAGDFEVTMSPRLADGGAHLYFREIGPKRRGEAEEERFHTRDSLTGLLSRAELVRRLGTQCRRRADDVPGLALMVIDIDRFSHLNDDHGFGAADEALRQLATRVRAILRARDAVARSGADEFAAMIGGADVTAERMDELALRVSEAIRRPLIIGGSRLEVTATIGMAIAPVDGREPEALFHAARLALDTARRDGVDRRMHQRRMDAASLADRMMEADLVQAMNSDGLELHYQPIMRLSDGVMVGAEALVRWRHPSRGLIPPDQFIPMAERSGRITALGAWVLDEACRRLASWRAGPLSGLRISVNISAIQLRDPDLARRVRATLAGHDIPGSSLKLEITETAAMSDITGTADCLWALRELGVEWSIDDFGTGYSSLSHLRRLPVSEVKIDRGFVADIDRDDDALAIVRAIISLGHDLGMTVVAEGVERPSQVALLTEMGCDVAQGFLYGRPQASAAFVASVPTKPLLIHSA